MILVYLKIKHKDGSLLQNMSFPPYEWNISINGKHNGINVLNYKVTILFKKEELLLSISPFVNTSSISIHFDHFSYIEYLKQ